MKIKFSEFNKQKPDEYHRNLTKCVKKPTKEEKKAEVGPFLMQRGLGFALSERRGTH